MSFVPKVPLADSVPVGLASAISQAGFSVVAGADAMGLANDVAAAHVTNAEPAKIVTQQALESAAAAMVTMPAGGGRTPQELTENAGDAIRASVRRFGSSGGYRMASADDEGPLTSWQPSMRPERFQELIKSEDFKFNWLAVGQTGNFALMDARYPRGRGVVLEQRQYPRPVKTGTPGVFEDLFYSIEVFGERDEFARAFTRTGRLVVFSTDTGAFMHEEPLVASGLLYKEEVQIKGVAVMRDDRRWNLLRVDGRPMNFIEVDQLDGRRRFLIEDGRALVELVMLREAGRRVPWQAPQPAEDGGPARAQEFLKDIGAHALTHEIGVTEEFCLKGTDGLYGRKVLVRKKDSSPVIDRVFLTLDLVGPKDQFAVGTTIEKERGVFSTKTGRMILRGAYYIETTDDGSTKLSLAGEDD